MAQTSKASSNGPSIDAMLRGLTERPNVLSTLILSRKDGSIIRATGDIVQHQSTRLGHSSYDWESMSENKEISEANQNDAGNTNGNEPAQDERKPVEILAGSIFQFVQSAASLGTTVGSTSMLHSSTDSVLNSRPDVPGEDDGSIAGDDEVQLLRLRTKNQEIIVFPDSNYICCVVQKVGKASNAPTRR